MADVILVRWELESLSEMGGRLVGGLSRQGEAGCKQVSSLRQITGRKTVDQRLRQTTLN